MVIVIESIFESEPIRVILNKLEAQKIDTTARPDVVSFNVDVKMDEENRTDDELTLIFTLDIESKPSLVQFVVGGKAVISGGKRAIDRYLEVDERSQVPRVLHTIYQRVFTSLFVVSSLLELPYPPPDLIHSPESAREGDALVDDQMAVATAQVQ